MWDWYKLFLWLKVWQDLSFNCLDSLPFLFPSTAFLPRFPIQQPLKPWRAQWELLVYRDDFKPQVPHFHDTEQQSNDMSGNNRTLCPERAMLFTSDHPTEQFHWFIAYLGKLSKASDSREDWHHYGDTYSKNFWKVISMSRITRYWWDLCNTFLILLQLNK